jgi:hypothetical protein
MNITNKLNNSTYSTNVSVFQNFRTIYHILSIEFLKYNQNIHQKKAAQDFAFLRAY